MGTTGGGDLGQAIRLLESRLQVDATDQATRLELIQAYTAAGRVDDFLREAEIYKAREKRLAGAKDTVAASDALLVESAGYFHAPVPEARKRFGSGPAARAPLATLAGEYAERRQDALYLRELDTELTRLAQRPTPLVLARRLSDHAGGARLFLKHENTGRTDPHLSIAVTGQVHLAMTLGRRQVYAGVRDLHWGVRIASACAHFGVQAHLFVDDALHDAQGAQRFQMQLMGAQVIPTKTARLPHGDIREAALAAWLARPADGFLCMGLDSGPDPYPQVARDLTAAIGRELRAQVVQETGRPPDVVVVRDGDNADGLGVLPAFLDEPEIKLVCVAPEPQLAQQNNKEKPFYVPENTMDAARASAILEGLEYESVARERSLLKATGRVEYARAAFNAAREALRNVARLEGVAIGFETAHALAHAMALAGGMPKDATVAVLLAERADKDLWDVARLESLGV